MHKKLVKLVLLLNTLTLCLCIQMCGKSDHVFRIVGGTEANKLEYPWMAFVRIRYIDSENHTIFITCGASLIDDQWLVTAAHCFDDSRQSDSVRVFVTLGANNLATHESTQFGTEEEKHILHPDYDPNDYYVRNDIAMIKLKNKLNLTGDQNYLQPICLPNSNSSNNVTVNQNNCRITGWGTTHTNNILESHVLMSANVSVISTYDCKLYYLGIQDTQVCAGSEGVGDCYGDSGGPLQCTLSNGVWVLVGVSSDGPEQCGTSTPSIYTNVQKFVQWIDKVRAEN